MPIASETPFNKAARSTAWVKRPGDFTRRGEDGPPLVSDPNGAIVKSKNSKRIGEPKLVQYRRPSSACDQIDNKYNLQRHKERQIVVAMGLNNSLPSRALDLAMRQDWSDDGKEWKNEVDGLVAACYEVIEADKHADRGTFIHKLVEDESEQRNWVLRLVKGEDLGLPAAMQTQTVAKWYEQIIVPFGFEVLASERPCVNDSLHLAGTLDTIVRLTKPVVVTMGDGRKVTIDKGEVIILDIKTGKLWTDTQSRVKFWNKYGAQVYAYASSVPYNCDDEVREEWPWPIRTDIGLIAHLPARAIIEEDAPIEWTLYPVDLEAGKHAAELAFMAHGWQDRNDVIGAPVLLTDPSINEEAEPSTTTEEAETPSTSTPTSTPSPISTETPIESLPPSSSPVATTTYSEPLSSPPQPSTDLTLTQVDWLGEQRSRLRERGKRLREAGVTVAEIKARWPWNLPMLTDDSHDWTEDDLRSIHLVLAEIEGERVIPFDPKLDSDRETTTSEYQAPTVGPDDPLDEETSRALRIAYDKLPHDTRVWMGLRLSEMSKVGHDYFKGGRATRRTLALHRVMVDMFEVATGFFGGTVMNDDVREFLIGCLPHSIIFPPSETIGSILAVMEVSELENLALELESWDGVVEFDMQGRLDSGMSIAVSDATINRWSER